MTQSALSVQREYTKCIYLVICHKHRSELHLRALSKLSMPVRSWSAALPCTGVRAQEMTRGVGPPYRW